MIDVAYVGNAGRNLPGFRNLNQRAVIQNANGSQAAGARPYPAFGDIQWMENRVSSDYNSLQVSAREADVARPDRPRELYAGAEALTDAPDHISTSGGGAGIDTGTFREPQDSYNLGADRGPAEFDIAHRFVASYVWELPFGHGRRFGNDWNKATDFVLGGWQLSGIHVLQSGLALTATLGGVDGAEPGRRAPRAAEPDRRSGAAESISARSIDGSTPTPSPRSVRRRRRSATPASASCAARATPTSTSRSRRISAVGGRRRFQFRTEVFNAFNRVNLGVPNIQRESSGFGQILGSGNARIVQFGLKFYF